MRYHYQTVLFHTPRLSSLVIIPGSVPKINRKSLSEECARGIGQPTPTLESSTSSARLTRTRLRRLLVLGSYMSVGIDACSSKADDISDACRRMSPSTAVRCPAKGWSVSATSCIPPASRTSFQKSEYPKLTERAVDIT